MVPLATALPALDVTYTPANSITIAEDGDYELTYLLTDATAANAGTLALYVRRNGAEIADSAVSATLSAGENFALRGTTIQTLTAGDVLDLALFTTSAQTVTLPEDLSANLVVKKLN